jgi:hypothetical protein
MLILFYFLVIEQILQGLHSLWGGLRWLRMAQRRVGSHPGFYALDSTNNEMLVGSRGRVFGPS